MPWEKVNSSQKFDYMVAPMSPGAHAGSGMIGFNLYGQDGWELIAIQDLKAYFKRAYIMQEVDKKDQKETDHA